MNINEGDTVEIVTGNFPTTAPKGANGEVLAVGTANTPPVPYFFVSVHGAAGPVVLGFYADEISKVYP